MHTSTISQNNTNIYTEYMHAFTVNIMHSRKVNTTDNQILQVCQKPHHIHIQVLQKQYSHYNEQHINPVVRYLQQVNQ